VSRGGGYDAVVGVPAALELPSAVLVAALTRLAAADTRADVAASVPSLLVEQPGVRACAVVTRDGRRAVVVGSAGYDCATMSTGATLPLEAGLPVTEAVATGRLVLRGSGPAWVAAPFGGRRASGALLLSLSVRPPAGRRDIEAVLTLARAVGGALQRAQAQEDAFVELALVTATLAQPPSSGGRGVAVRTRRHEGVTGPDVVVCVDDGGATWLVVVDVRRRGLEAAVLARTARAAVTAVVPHVAEPAAVVRAVLTSLDDSGSGPGASVVVARVARREVVLAGSQSPPPALLSGGRVVLLEDHLRAGEAPVTRLVRPAEDAVLVLHSDGLTRRGGAELPLADLLPAAPLPDVEGLADHLLRAADGVALATDDVAVLVARLADLA
jgi:hypothetical protein